MEENARRGSHPLHEFETLARAFGDIVVSAGKIVLQIRSRNINVRSKKDASPVTDADEQAETAILNALAELCPDIPTVSEEAAAAGRRVSATGKFLLVDPLDGTREFVAGLDEFTVNIALISDGLPVAGAVYQPNSGRLWFGAGEAYFCQVADPGGGAVIGPAVPIRTRRMDPATAVALVSRTYTDARATELIKAAGVAMTLAAGSSLKFCLIAEGHADIYPRFGPTNAWDIAAGDAVLRAAGGILLQPDGSPVLYNAENCASPHFIAFGDPEAGKRLLATAAR